MGWDGGECGVVGMEGVEAVGGELDPGRVERSGPAGISKTASAVPAARLVVADHPGTEVPG